METRDTSNAGGDGAARAVLLALAYVLPPLLLWSGAIPHEYRFHTLLTMTALMSVYAFARGHTTRELGFRTDTLKGSLAWNGCVTLLLAACMFAAYSAGMIREPTRPKWEHFYLFYVIVSSPAQEFLFRSLPFAEMDRARLLRPPARVLLSSAVYCFAHVFYGDLITLAVTLSMGVVWGIIYHKHPNFWGVMLSHAALGVMSIEVGII